jgi:3-oxoacyl-[acyl-carrier protein] reductase
VDLGIAGRTAVVTGGSRGIGRAVAGLLTAEGARVVVTARGAADLEAAVASLAGPSGGPVGSAGSVVGVAGDVCDPATTAAILDAAGGVDILVNNAGSDSGHLPFDRLTDEDWESAYRLNVVSTVRLSVAALPHMQAQGWGRIVNVASYTARVPEPFCAPYAAAKAALVNVTRNLSRAYASSGVCANCVLPGLTDTDATRAGFSEAAAASGRPVDELLGRMLQRAPIDVGRMGTADEVAAAVVFLCSAQASWITGAALAVDGGTIRSAP